MAGRNQHTITAHRAGAGTDAFVEHRNLLFTIAYEMLGSAADAEDVLQETWLRWARVDLDTVRDRRAYLVRTTTRQALTQLRRLQRRKESYVGPWLPEPLLTTPDVAEDVALADSFSIAMLLVLETLSPTERAVFVLREVFGVEYFMENHVHPWIGIRGKYSVLRVVPEGVTVQMIAADDIGAFATPVFADPTTHLGRVHELAGDQFTKAELSTKNSGHRSQTRPNMAEKRSWRPEPDPGKLTKGGSFAGWHADIPALRRTHPGLKTYDAWLNAGRRDAFRKLFGQT